MDICRMQLDEKTVAIAYWNSGWQGVCMCVCREWKLVESIESGKINEQITKSWEPVNLGVGGGKQVSKK